MFNQSELQGEVDHSFFDSDCDDGPAVGDAGKKKNLKKDNQPVHEKLHAKQPENTKIVFPRTDCTKTQLKPVENNGNSKADLKEQSCETTEQSRRASEVSSVTGTSYNGNSNSDYNSASKRPNGTLLNVALSRGDDDHSMRKQSLTETEEETLSSIAKHTSSEARNKHSPKRRIRNRYTRSPSPTSSETSVDTDSESSCSSVKGRCGLEPLALPRSIKALSRGVRRIRVGSLGSGDICGYSTKDTGESEDTATDVSPLSSPDPSPPHSLDLTEAEDVSPSEQHQQEKEEDSVPSSGLGNIRHDEDLDQDNDNCSFSSESQFDSKLVFHCPVGRNRKNHSFTNDQVSSIDRENQRLLRELSRLSGGPRPGSTAGKKSPVASKYPVNSISHSAHNRQREQQRIERENQAFLKRLESVKPTPGLKRSQQLAEYQRHIGYQGGPSYSVCLTNTRKDRSATKTPSGPSPITSVHHSSRPVSTISESRNTAVTRPKKMNTARPAWC